MPGRLPQQIGVAFALCAFAVAVGAGLVTSVPATAVVLRAIVVLIVTYPIGCALGRVLRTALNEHLTAVAAANPIPEPIHVSTDGADYDGDVEVIGDVDTL